MNYLELRRGGDGDVSVTFADRGIPIATASANRYLVPSVWWVARALVKENYRHQGLGKRALSILAGLAKLQGAKYLQVCPGGYDTPYEEQEAFYIASGFEKLADGLLQKDLRNLKVENPLHCPKCGSVQVSGITKPGEEEVVQCFHCDHWKAVEIPIEGQSTTDQ